VVVEGERVRKLKKALYGLRRAPKAWHTTFTDWAIREGFSQLQSSECVFVHVQVGAMLAIYVDDLLVAAETADGVKEIQALIGQRFQVRHVGVPRYFLGMDVVYSVEKGVLHLCQETYVRALREKYEQFLKSPRKLPIICGVNLNREQGEVHPTVKPYSSLVGALLFLSVCTRPDISFAVGTLAKFLSCPGEEHWKVAIDVLSYVINTKDKGIVLGKVDRIRRGIVGFSDSDWANDTDDRKSVSGGALFWEGNLVSWWSRKQNMVCTSTAEAEVHALLGMVEAVRNVKCLLEELVVNFFGDHLELPTILTDNEPALDAIRAKRGRTKHYDIKVKHIAEAVGRNEFQLQYVPTAVNLADVFTKALRAVRFHELIDKLMMNRNV
jgi:hypothetical protein